MPARAGRWCVLLPSRRWASDRRVSVLADVLNRDGAVLSATETLRQEMSQAGHPGVLGSVWHDQVRAAQAVRFEKALRDVLPDADAGAALSDAARTWLWRSLRQAFAALGRVDGIDLRGMPDDKLRLRRALYERETAWAPRHVGEELRLARLQARTAWENVIREDHEARAGADPGVIQRHQALAAMWRAMEAKASRITAMLADAQETRRQWEAITEPTRRVALAADIEFRRRYPERVLEPLKSAEPEGGAHAVDGAAPASPPRQDVWVQETLGGMVHLAGETQAKTGDEHDGVFLTQAQREVRGQQAPGLTPETVADAIPEEVLRIREKARIQAKITTCAALASPPKTTMPRTSASPGTSSLGATVTPSSSLPSPRSFRPRGSSAEWGNAAPNAKLSPCDISTLLGVRWVGGTGERWVLRIV